MDRGGKGKTAAIPEEKADERWRAFYPPDDYSALVQALVEMTRGRGERPHLLLASQDVRSDAGQDIVCRYARNFSTDLRCAPQEWTASASGMDRRRAIAEKNGVAGGSALRSIRDLRLCSKKSTYDIRPLEPMPALRSEVGM